MTEYANTPGAKCHCTTTVHNKMSTSTMHSMVKKKTHIASQYQTRT